MSKIRVVKNMFDAKCGVTRKVGDEFEVKDTKRIDELLKSGSVELIKDKVKELNK